MVREMKKIKTYSAVDLANYLRSLTNVEEGDLLSNLKLQKLCYYVQGIAVAVRDVPMFSEQIEAWQHGPVVPEIYREYSNRGSSDIPPPKEFDSLIFSKADISLINDVYDHYAQFSAWKLRNMTHEESPWVNAYKNDTCKTITIEALREFFSQEIEEGYKSSYHGQVQATQ